MTVVTSELIKLIIADQSEETRPIDYFHRNVEKRLQNEPLKNSGKH